MAAIRLTALWKTTLRRPSSFARFCTTKSGDDGNDAADGGNTATSDSSSTKNAPNMRGEETKGALKSFMAQTGASTDGVGLWAKLRREATSEKSEPRPWTQAGAPQRPQPQRPVVAGGGVGAPRKSTDATRSFNPRTTGGPKKFTGGKNSDDGPALTGVSTYLGGGATRRGKKEVAEEEVETYDIKALYAEHMKTNPIEIIRLAKIAGGALNTKGMDELDTFLANVWMESYSTSDDVVRDVMVLPNFKKARIPQPRSIRELVGVMTPNITDAPAGSDANKLGQAAWGVLSKNYYFSEKDKSYIANTIARRMVKIEALKLEQRERERINPEENQVDGDAIFQKDFRKGYMGYLADRRAARRASAQGKGLRNVNTNIITGDTTDWDQEAVADEDDFYSEYGVEEDEDTLQDDEEEVVREYASRKLLADEEPSRKKKDRGGGNRRKR